MRWKNALASSAGGKTRSLPVPATPPAEDASAASISPGAHTHTPRTPSPPLSPPWQRKQAIVVRSPSPAAAVAVRACGGGGGGGGGEGGAVAVDVCGLARVTHIEWENGGKSGGGERAEGSLHAALVHGDEVHICVYVHMYIFIHKYMCIHIHAYIYVFLCIFI